MTNTTTDSKTNVPEAIPQPCIAQGEQVYSAKTADKHLLYERAVQTPQGEVKFIDRVYKKRNGKLPRSLREDFCGTAYLCSTWVQHRKSNTAVGVDFDPAVLAWAKENHVNPLTNSQQSRLHLIKGDVLTTPLDTPVDVVAALNFSYFTFKKREQLRAYFSTVRDSLTDTGIFVCDCYGGFEAQDIVEEERPCNGFAYVWHQAHFNPVTSETLCHIHFHFPDETSIMKAFTYDWRLWSLMEIQEVLKEVGFTKTTVYWEGTDTESNEGNGVFRPTTKGEVCPGWIAYLVAEM